MKRMVLVAAIVGVACLMTTSVLAATAEENYNKHCMKCHGADGDGGGPAADVLEVPPTDFTDCERMKTLSDEYLLKVIGSGGEAVGKSSQMPASTKIPQEEHPGLVEFVRSFCE